MDGYHERRYKGLCLARLTFVRAPAGGGDEQRRSRGPWFPLVEKRDEWGSLSGEWY
jgi:hypothetical protein